MNDYFKNLNKIEFAMTMACTGRCRHCQNGDPADVTEHIDAAVAVGAIRRVCEKYNIRTVMTFGGEPLLYHEDVCAIHSAARALGVETRQVITNGCFSREPERIEAVARHLADSGVNDLLLSVDAFHQEVIPLEPVMRFAECAVKAAVPIQLCPSWLVSPGDDNPYNLRTRELLRAFEPLRIAVGEGNVVFPSGKALTNLREYFGEDVAEFSPYDDDPEDVRALSVEPNGNLLDGNLYRTDILEIMRAYRP